MVAESEVTVKASPYLSVRAFMNESLSADARERVLVRLSEESPAHASLLRQRVVVVSDRIPVLLLNRLIELMAGELRQPPEIVANSVGRRSAKDSSSGVLRLAMIMISIPSLLRKLAPVWTQMYSHGTMTSRSEDRSAVVELTDYPVVSAAGCARVTGTLQWFAEAAEKNATVHHTSCRGKGAAICRWDVRW
jgi:hypothetical protein